MEKDKKHKRFELFIDLLKWVLGTMVLGGASIFINSDLEETKTQIEAIHMDQALALQEYEVLATFVPVATSEDVDQQQHLAFFFSKVLRDSSSRDRWRRYGRAFKKQVQNIASKTTDEVRDLKEKVKKVNEAEQDATLEEAKMYQQQRYELQQQIDQLTSRVEKIKSTNDTIAASIDSTGFVDNVFVKSASNKDSSTTLQGLISALANDKNACMLFDFHNKKQNYYECFTAGVVLNQVDRYQDTKGLLGYQEVELGDLMERMFMAKLLEKDGCKKNYYSAEDYFEPSVKLFQQERKY